VKCRICLGWAWFLGAAALLGGESRRWTNLEGVEIVAEFVSQDAAAGEVTIRRKGRDFTLEIAKLSEADRSWLEQQAAAEARANAVSEHAGQVRSFTSEGEHRVTYHVSYPPQYRESQPPPMIIMFSPGGNGRGILGTVKAAAAELGWIAVGCDVFRNGVDSEILDPKFEEMLPHLEKTVTHDPQRLYLGGMSGGALRAYQYTEKFDRPWKGVFAMGGWLGGATRLDCPRKMAVVIANGDKDEAANSHNASVIEILEGRRCKVEVMGFPGGHVTAPPEIALKALRWIDEKTDA